MSRRSRINKLSSFSSFLFYTIKLSESQSSLEQVNSKVALESVSMAKRSAEGRASPAEDSDLMKITPLGSGQEVGAELGTVRTIGHLCPAAGGEELSHRPVQGQEDHAGLWHPPRPHWHGRSALCGHDRGRPGQASFCQKFWSWEEENWVLMRTGSL